MFRVAVLFLSCCSQFDKPKNPMFFKVRIRKLQLMAAMGFWDAQASCVADLPPGNAETFGHQRLAASYSSGGT